MYSPPNWHVIPFVYQVLKLYWVTKTLEILYVYHLPLVLVYHGPLQIQLLGVASHLVGTTISPTFPRKNMEMGKKWSIHPDYTKKLVG